MLRAMVLAAATLAAGMQVDTANAQALDLGREALPEEVAAWDIDIRPDGAGLPEGGGNVVMGEELFTDQCASCHGDFGEAVGRWPVLAGGFDTLDGEDPVKTVGSYWPYLSTVYDYVNRAMPFGNAQSLSADETYAITAYLLYLNDLVDEDFELSKANFGQVRLPNEENFFADDRPQTEMTSFSEAPCMENCKDSVEITARARVIDVTPDETEVVAQVEEAAPASAEPVAAAPDPELVAAGEKVFRKCKACHAVGAGAKNKSGPHLNGIVGRAFGAVEGFKYSKVVTAAATEGRVWDDTALAEFLTKPKSFLKGTKMSFSGLRKEADVDAIIAYLGTIDP